MQFATTDQLIEACLKGDQRAWEAIVHQYRRRVFNVAYKFVGRHDEAEDLTQEIFLKVFKALDTFDRRANFQTWLISISRNLCIDHYRSVRKEREIVDRHVDAADCQWQLKTAHVGERAVGRSGRSPVDAHRACWAGRRERRDRSPGQHAPRRCGAGGHDATPSRRSSDAVRSQC